MREYAEFLRQQQSQNAEMAATLTLLELANLFALLDHVQLAGDAEATIGLATSLFTLLQTLGRPRLLERAAQTRDAAEAALGQTWNHARFQAVDSAVDQQLASGRLREAFEIAHESLRRARVAGETAYPNADYDLAMACFTLARVWKTVGGSEKALPLLQEAQRRFESVARPGREAEGMACLCFAERGDCLTHLGRLDEAAAAYEQNIRCAEQLANDRQVAVGKGQLGTVRLEQRRYEEALKAYDEARERFTRLNEPGSIAAIWHQMGRVYEEAGKLEAAEDAYRKSLAIEVRLGNVAGQATTLLQLGTLSDDQGRIEEAAAFARQAAEKYAEIRDLVDEGKARSNLAHALKKLRRLDEARQEIQRAIEGKTQFGQASEPWKSWDILADIETDAGNPAAAAQAKRKAIECYLAYRRDGGENHYPDGRIALAVTHALLAGDPAAATSLVQEIAANPDLPAWFPPFIQALQAIVAGSRDRTLADDPDLYYRMAAEILVLIDTLEQKSL
jgi:tetratricopeptide (TPR) repeat protein